MPVGFGKICPDHEILVAESIEHVAHDVGVLAVGIRAGSHFIVGLLGVEHAESVVVLGRENHIFETVVLGKRSPVGRLELGWVEFIGEVPVPLFELAVGRTVGSCLETAVGKPAVFGTERPRFGYTGHGVHAPVEHDAKFLILPFVELGKNLGVGWILVFVGCGMYESRFVGHYFL